EDLVEMDDLVGERDHLLGRAVVPEGVAGDADLAAALDLFLDLVLAGHDDREEDGVLELRAEEVPVALGLALDLAAARERHERLLDPDVREEREGRGPETRIRIPVVEGQEPVVVSGRPVQHVAPVSNSRVTDCPGATGCGRATSRTPRRWSNGTS